MTHLNKPYNRVKNLSIFDCCIYYTFQQATVSSSLQSLFFTIHVYKCTRIRVQVEPKCFESQFRTHSNFELCMHWKFDRFQWLGSCKQT